MNNRWTLLAGWIIKTAQTKINICAVGVYGILLLFCKRILIDKENRYTYNSLVGFNDKFRVIRV